MIRSFEMSSLKDLKVGTADDGEDLDHEGFAGTAYLHFDSKSPCYMCDDNTM